LVAGSATSSSSASSFTAAVDVAGSFDHRDADTFVGTVDGSVHAISKSGMHMWSFSSGDTLLSSSVSLERDGVSGDEKPVLIPGVDGTIFARSADKTLQRMPITVKGE
jgi:hypothetical protein